MKRSNPRSHRIGDQIQRELAEILRTEVKDPRVGMITVTAVEITADLAHAKVFVTDLAGRERSEDVLVALKRASGFMRSELARRLSIFSVPQLHFAYDDSIEHGMRMSSLIDKAVASDRRDADNSDKKDDE